MPHDEENRHKNMDVKKNIVTQNNNENNGKVREKTKVCKIK